MNKNTARGYSESANRERQNVSALPDVERDTVERVIRLTFRLRERRQQLLADEHIDEVAWCMLLDLYLGHLEGARLYVSALCSNTYATATTSLRRLECLIDSGLACRVRNDRDARRIAIALTASGIEKAHAYICHVYSEAMIALGPEIAQLQTWRAEEARGGAP